MSRNVEGLKHIAAAATLTVLNGARNVSTHGIGDVDISVNSHSQTGPDSPLTGRDEIIQVRNICAVVGK